mmetsp:Transcript_34283/g.39030  ORF Transcript_34283/g.39030 Transcript_34283/m.39030 type:complete len:225 (+) Transcript_34283:124-798(+)
MTSVATFRKRPLHCSQETQSEPATKIRRLILPDQSKHFDHQKTNPHEVLQKIFKSQGLNVITNDSLTLEGFFVDYTEEELNAYDKDILTAIRKQDIEKLREFHANGRPLKCSNRFGESILHMACRRGFLNVVQFLIKEAKVTVRIRDDCGRTILHDAAWTPEPNFEIIKIILEECPELLYMKDRRGHTPISYARQTHWAAWNKFLKESVHLIIPPTKSCRKLSQ